MKERLIAGSMGLLLLGLSLGAHAQAIGRIMNSGKYYTYGTGKTCNDAKADAAGKAEDGCVAQCAAKSTITEICSAVAGSENNNLPGENCRCVASKVGTGTIQAGKCENECKCSCVTRPKRSDRKEPTILGGE